MATLLVCLMFWTWAQGPVRTTRYSSTNIYTSSGDSACGRSRTSVQAQLSQEDLYLRILKVRLKVFQGQGALVGTVEAEEQLPQLLLLLEFRLLSRLHHQLMVGRGHVHGIRHKDSRDDVEDRQAKMMPYTT